MTTYTNQLRALADCLRHGEEFSCGGIPIASVVIALEEAAEKIDMLDKVIQASQNVIATYDDPYYSIDKVNRSIRKLHNVLARLS